MKSINDIFLKGDTIYLKVLTEEDVLNSNWYGWFNNEETTKWMQKHYFPNTRSEQLEFYNREIKGSKSKLQLGICKKDDNKLLGSISLENIDYLNRNAEISTVIGEKEGRNIKIIIEIYKLILNHAFNTINLQRIYTGTMSKEFAILMERLFNFKREGILRNHIFKNGSYHDSYMHGLLKSEFKNKIVK